MADLLPQPDKRSFPWHWVGLGSLVVAQAEIVAYFAGSLVKGPKNPVESVSWNDCQKFLGKLNMKSAAEGGKFQLPTEAQRE